MTIGTLFPISGPVVLAGRVTRILFRDAESLMTGVRVKVKGAGEETVVGEFLDVAEGDRFVFTGHWDRHPKYGMQLRLLHAQKELPRAPEAIAAYLAGGLFPGVGKTTARRIVEHFGAETLVVLLAEPERLAQVPAIGAKRRAKLLESFREHRYIQELALFLQGHGVSLNLTRKIHRRYGPEALAIVRSDPYRVADDIPGIGFVRADDIARKTGLPADAPSRVRAAVRFVLKERCETRGHSYLPVGALVSDSLAFLNRPPAAPAVAAVSAPVTRAAVAVALDELAAAGRIVREGTEAVYLSEVHAAEVALATRLTLLLATAFQLPAGVDDVVAATAAAAGIVYAREQTDAMRTALTSPIAVVTGGPGTGKSTIVRGVVAAFEAFESLRGTPEILLAAPTGRAAKRLAEVTGRGAKTIHRLLEFSPEGATFLRDEAAPLTGDLLVVDEASMVDLQLAAALLRAVPPGMQVLLVGDADQLPPVGIGNVFADVIASGTVPVVRLRHIFRQAGESRIVTNAHRVNAGLLPGPESGADWRFVPAEGAEAAAAYVRRVAEAARAAGLGLDAFSVLTPMRKTAAGTIALNQLLQETLNPPSPEKRELRAGATVFRTGDKVMQLRNNYRKEVFNGDIGLVATIARPSAAAATGVGGLDSVEPSESPESDDDEEQLCVDFDGRIVAYEQHELDQLALAYASTVHKAQGSEFKGVVILPIVNEHHIMLQRNLLYTAITRARERVVLVGQEEALRRAVRNLGSGRRYSGLQGRLTAQS